MRATIIIMLVLALTGCKKSAQGGGSGNVGEAVAVLAVAGTLAIIQAARARADQHTAKQDCSLICNACQVPCGSECLPYGTLCYSPPGRACRQSVDPGVPKPEPPDICLVAPGFYIERTPSLTIR